MRYRQQLAFELLDFRFDRVVVDGDAELEAVANLVALGLRKIGISTPSRITVTTVVTTAAMLGAPLRRSARNASWVKKRSRDI